MKIKIGKKLIGDSEKTFVIAEIGAKYWEIEKIKVLMKKAVDNGADAVKIQTYRAENLTEKNSVFEFGDGTTMSQYDFFKKYEFSIEDHKELFEFAKRNNIILFSTPSHIEDVVLLENFNPPAYKVGSDDLTNYPLIEYIALQKRPIILSTGMSFLGEIEKAVEVIEKAGNKKIIILHCISGYPPREEDANLKVIEILKKMFPYPIGFSDHYVSSVSSAFAVIAGAKVVEKHLTFSRREKIGDYFVSLEPLEFREMVKNIRLAEKMIGNERRKVFKSEKRWRKNARKSIAAARDLKEGMILQKNDLFLKRPGNGFPGEFIQFFVGKKLSKNVKKGEFIKFKHIEDE